MFWSYSSVSIRTAVAVFRKVSVEVMFGRLDGLRTPRLRVTTATVFWSWRGTGRSVLCHPLTLRFGNERGNLHETSYLSNVHPFCVYATVPPMFNDAVSTSNCSIHCHHVKHRFHYRLHSKTEKTSPKCCMQSESNQFHDTISWK